MQGSEALAFPSQDSSYSNLNFQDISRNKEGLNSSTTTQVRPTSVSAPFDQPTFSPFPRLPRRPPNVPPSDDEREGILEAARNPVLSSNDPEMQLTWAQDTLAYVETVTQDDIRIAEPTAPRPQTPQVVHQLKVDAINVVTFLADQQHPKADFMKGMWLEFGKFGYRMDKREAYRCFSRAAQRGYTRAEYRMGMQYEEASNDPGNAIKHYHLGVEAGDSASMYRLGMMMLLGQHGQPLDYVQGLELIRRSSETADENAPQGAYIYGMLLSHELTQVPIPDEYLPFNVGAARHNIEKAAYLGFAKAQTKMGAAYELCQLGCDFDPALSLHYNALAARQGDADAEMAISKWFLCGYDGIFEKNEELAYVYAQRAASTGLGTAEFALGYFHEIGVHVRVDIDMAKKWYAKAAEHGNKDASARIDGIQRSNTLKKEHQDVAVAKIRSQYGSQQGKRPGRFKAPSAPMPMISDNPDVTEVPDPDQYRPPSRLHSTSSSPAPPRSQSVAPYPVDDNFQQRHSLKPLPSTQSLRPMPDFRPNTAMGIPPAGTPLGSLQSQPLHRPYSSIDLLGAGRGMGAPLQTGPGAVSPQHYRQPSLGSPITQGASTAGPPGPQIQAPGGLNLGFVAPPDPFGADRRRRLQKSDNPHANSKPLPTNSTYDAPPERASTKASNTPGAPSRPLSSHHRPTDRPQPGSSAHDSRPNQAHPHPSSFPQNPRLNQGPPHPSSFPQNPRPNQGPPPPTLGNKPPLIPPKVAASERPTATPPASIVSRPPGKGPKTFQEMGVPATKHESECVSEACLSESMQCSNLGSDSHVIFWPQRICHERFYGVYGIPIRWH